MVKTKKRRSSEKVKSKIKPKKFSLAYIILKIKGWFGK